MKLAEDMVKYIINEVLENAPEEMAFFNQFMDKGLIERLENLVNSDFGRITYTRGNRGAPRRAATNLNIQLNGELTFQTTLKDILLNRFTKPLCYRLSKGY